MVGEFICSWRLYIGWVLLGEVVGLFFCGDLGWDRYYYVRGFMYWLCVVIWDFRSDIWVEGKEMLEFVRMSCMWGVDWIFLLYYILLW